ncbi:hypothetical protein JTE90_021630 [Oedothorax gibbosus]|uniref:Uncharacterized protein n=1 Tax=Oedothorax gibbosus TaxID=931172 RepID=A0AAV6VPG1_9ARAC|nr:hypothetical protein JTE90_021630 [Oedothorax gibbosus]
MESIRGYPVDDLKLMDVTLPYLPAGLFFGTKVKRLNILASHLDNLYNTQSQDLSPFQGLEDSLEEINIIATESADSWYWPDMKDFKRMKKVAFYSSPISFIGHQFAEIGGGSLEVLSVQKSKTYRLHPQGFTEMKNLREADFEANEIPYLVRTMFPNPAPKLETLNFRFNKLFTLNENMFENMPALKSLDLSYNMFKSFQEVPFKPIWKRYFSLALEGNPFQCECNLVTLKEKFLNGSVPLTNDFDQVTCTYKGSDKKTELIDVNGNDPRVCLW